MTNLTLGPAGEMTLPPQVQARYGLTPETAVRIVETRGGILLVPLTGLPPSGELAEELLEWQALGQETWAALPYEDDTP